MRSIEIPGDETLELEHVVFDLNGTLADHGRLIEGVRERLGLLVDDFRLHVVTADTFGVVDRLTAGLGVTVTTISSGTEKASYVERLGPERVVAVGNGRNDVAMLSLARLGIAVIGPEGASTAALGAATVVCHSITDALDLLLDDRAIAATLRP
jgi:soluble P-type ATPase